MYVGQGAQDQYGCPAEAQGGLLPSTRPDIGALWIAPMGGDYFQSVVESGGAIGPFAFTQSAQNAANVTTTAATTSGAVLTVASVPAWLYPGVYVQDITSVLANVWSGTDAAIPANTTVVSSTSTTITLSASVIGSGVKLGDQINFTFNPGIGIKSTGGPEIKFEGGIGATMEIMSKDGSINHGNTLTWNGKDNTWAWSNISGELYRFIGGDYTGSEYSGPDFGGVAFQNGILIGNFSSGDFRNLDAGTAAPSFSNAKRGNVRFNYNPAPGGAVGWADVTGSNGFNPFGPIANDTAGATWVFGNFHGVTPIAISALGTCSATLIGQQAFVNNGITNPTYHQGVVSAGTGSSEWPVWCAFQTGTGYGWIY